jgi:hypothetical protein
MKTSLLSRLSLLCGLLVLSATGAMAQTSVYTEAPIVAKSGYWSLVTDQQHHDHTVVQFYNDQHELLYEEVLAGLYLDLSKSGSGRRRLSRLLGSTLQQVQQMRGSSLVTMQMAALTRVSRFQ